MTLPPRLYGIWIPGQGWWRINGRAYADARLSTAQHYARWLGQHARVEPIDKSLEDGEEYLKEAERIRRSKSLWHILKNFKDRSTRR